MLVRSLCLMDIPPKTKLLTTGVLLRSPHQSGSEISPHSATDTFFPQKSLCLCLHQDPVLQDMSHRRSGSLEMSQCSTQVISVPSRLTMPNGQTRRQNFPRKMTLQISSGGCLLVTKQIGRPTSRAIFSKPFCQPAPRAVHPQEHHVHVQQVKILTWTQIPTKSNQTMSPEPLATISSVACTKPASRAVYRQGEGPLHNLNVLD